MNETELMHYGVKGMKWGVRRKLRKSADFQSDKKNVKSSHRKYLDADNKYDNAVRKAGAEFDKKRPYDANSTRNKELERQIDRYAHVVNKSYSAKQDRDSAKSRYKQLLNDTVKKYGDTLVGDIKISERSRQRIDRIIHDELVRDILRND